MNNAGRVDGIAAAFYNAIKAERKGGSLNQCASITFIVPRKYVRISPENAEGKHSSECAVLPSITSRGSAAGPALPPRPLTESSLIVTRRRDPGKGYYSTLIPLSPPSHEAERDKPPRHNFKFFPRESAPVFYDVSPSVLLIAA